MDKNSSEELTFDHVKTTKITTKSEATDTGSDHRLRANYIKTADMVNNHRTVSSISSSSQTANMKDEPNSSLTSSSIDSGYQSDSPGRIPCIGNRVGLGSFDLLSELAKVEPNLVRNIVRQASSTTEDLINVSEVCPTWQSCLSLTDVADIEKHREKQDQETVIHKENLPKEKTSKRCVTESESPLTEVQEIGQPQFTSTPKSVTVKEDSSDADGLYQKFHDISQTLFNDESLTKCARHGCQAPAKHSLNKQKGQCTSSHCQFEFCTNCRCEFHGGQPCKVFEKKSRTKKEGGIGSRKSKRNLQRLGKL